MKKLLYLFGMLLIITCDEYQNETYGLSDIDSRICESISLHDSNAVNIDAYAFSHIAGLSTGLPTNTWIMVSDSGEIIDETQKTFRIKSNSWFGVPFRSSYALMVIEANILLGDSLYLYPDTASVLNPEGNLVYVADSNWVILPDMGWILVMDDGTTQEYTSDIIPAIQSDFINSTITTIIDSLYADTINIVVDTLIVDSVHIVIDSLSIDTTYAVYTAHKNTLLKMNSGENYGFELLSVDQLKSLVFGFDKYIEVTIMPINNSNVGDELISDTNMPVELVAECQKYDSFKGTLIPYIKTRLVYDLAPGEYLIFYHFEDVGDQTSSSNKSFHLVMTDNN